MVVSKQLNETISSYELGFKKGVFIPEINSLHPNHKSNNDMK